MKPLEQKKIWAAVKSLIVRIEGLFSSQVNPFRIVENSSAKYKDNTTSSRMFATKKKIFRKEIVVLVSLLIVLKESGPFFAKKGESLFKGSSKEQQ